MEIRRCWLVLLVLMLLVGISGADQGTYDGWGGGTYQRGLVSQDVDHSPLALGMRNGDSFDWTTEAAEDSMDIVATYDMHEFSKGFFYAREPRADSEMPMDEIVARNPGIRLLMYDHPGVWSSNVTSTNYMQQTMRDTLWSYRVFTNEASGKTVARELPDNFYWHTEWPKAREAYVKVMRQWRERLAGRFGEAGASAWGAFHDGRPPTYTGSYVDSLAAVGWPDLDGDGIQVAWDTDYFSTGKSESQVVYESQLAIIDDLREEFGDDYKIVLNGAIAWTDSIGSRHATHLIQEDMPLWQPFSANGFGDILAGGQRTRELYQGVTKTDYISAASYERWQSAPGGPSGLFNPAGVADDEGYNIDEIQFISRCLGVGYSPSSTLRDIDPIPSTVPEAMAPLGRLISYNNVGEYLHGVFRNGNAFITTSFGVGDLDNQADYWAVNASGDTLISHWHGEETYTYKFGLNSTIGSPYDRNVDQGSNGIVRSNELRADDPTKIGSASCRLSGGPLPMDSGVGTWGIIQFNGSAGGFDAQMRRTLAGKRIKSATLHMVAAWLPMTITSPDTFFVIGATNPGLAGWNRPNNPGGSPESCDATFNMMDQTDGVPWGVDLSAVSSNREIGQSITAVTGLNSATTEGFKISVTEQVKDACALNAEGTDYLNSWAGFWLRHSEPGNVSYYGVNSPYAVYLTVETYAPWVDVPEDPHVNILADSWDIRDSNDCWAVPPIWFNTYPNQPGLHGPSAVKIELLGTPYAGYFQDPYQVVGEPTVVYSVYVKNESLNTGNTTKHSIYDRTLGEDHQIKYRFDASGNAYQTGSGVGVDDSGIESFGDGWWRVWIMIDLEARGIVDNLLEFRMIPAENTSVNGESFFVSGFQAEGGAKWPSEYDRKWCSGEPVASLFTKPSYFNVDFDNSRSTIGYTTEEIEGMASNDIQILPAQLWRSNYAGYVDLVDDIHAVNPECLILGYVSVYGIYTGYGSPSMDTYSVLWRLANDNNGWAKDLAGDFVLNGENDHRLLNFASAGPAFADSFAIIVANEFEKSGNAQAYTGLFLDWFDEGQWPAWAVNTAELDLDQNGIAHASDAAEQAAYVSGNSTFLNALRTEINARSGFDPVIVLNGSDVEAEDEYNGIVNGTMWENFEKGSLGSQYKWERAAESSVGFYNDNFPLSINFADAMEDSAFYRMEAVGLLVGAHGGVFPYSASNNNRTAAYRKDRRAIRIDLGSPIGSLVYISQSPAGQDTVRRAFERGHVTVTFPWSGLSTKYLSRWANFEYLIVNNAGEVLSRDGLPAP